MDTIDNRSRWIYEQQRGRCYNKNNPSYIYYGSKGIGVTYTLKEFRLWYRKNVTKFKGDHPHVGRLDHSKSYCFNNIKIQSRSSNIKERNRRVGLPDNKKPVWIFNIETSQEFSFDSIKDTAKFLKRYPQNIIRELKSKTRHIYLKKWILEYANC